MTATGFDFEPLPNGDVLIEFFGDDGVTINTQVITKECLAKMPVVAHALFVAVEQGQEAALAFLNGWPSWTARNKVKSLSITRDTDNDHEIHFGDIHQAGNDDSHRPSRN